MFDTSLEKTRKNLIADLDKVIVDAEKLLKSAGNDGSEKAEELRASVEENLRVAKKRLQDLDESLTDKIKSATHVANSYVKQHSWQTVALGASVGVLVGLLISRRD